MDAPDLNEPINYAKAQRNELAGIFGDQRGETSDYLSRFGSFLKSQPTTSAMAERIGAEMGIPTLRANSQSLQNTLYNLPSVYSKATTGHDVNANQLDRIVGTKQAELAPAASLAQSNLGNAEAALGTRLGYEQADLNRQLLPYQSEQSLLSDRLARETTGYTTQMGRELDTLIAKMNAGVTLSEGEKTRANQLAIAEKSYQAAIESAKISANRPMALESGQGIYNPSNGSYKQFGWG